MKVTLRQRNQGGKTSLYLDYYHNKKRKTEYLKLYLEAKPKTKQEREVNKKTQQLAETIRVQRQIEIQSGVYGFRDNEKLKGSLTAYIELLAEKRKDRPPSQANWYSMLKHFKSFNPIDITFDKADTKFVQEFKDYLDKQAKTKVNVGLSQNSKREYFNNFRIALKQAVKDGIIATNPTEGVATFKKGETQREFLTLEELQAAVQVNCEIPQIKTAFISSDE